MIINFIDFSNINVIFALSLCGSVSFLLFAHLIRPNCMLFIYSYTLGKFRPPFIEWEIMPVVKQTLTEQSSQRPNDLNSCRPIPMKVVIIVQAYIILMNTICDLRDCKR